MAEEKQEYFSVSEAANLLGISYRTMRRLVQEGEIVAVVFPGMDHKRISREEIDRYIERAEVTHG